MYQELPLNIESWRPKARGPLQHEISSFVRHTASENIFSLREEVRLSEGSNGADVDLARFFELSRDPLCIANTDGSFVRVNAEFKRMLGYSEEELTERAYLDFVHPDDREATSAESERLRKGEPVLNFQNRYRCKDDSWKNLLWRTSPPDDQGLIYAVARDLTEELRRRESRNSAQKRTMSFQETLLRLRDIEREGLEDFFRLATLECAYALDVERVSVWFYIEDGGCLECRDLYRRTADVHESGLRIERDDFPRYFDVLSSRDALVVEDAWNDAVTREFRENYLRPHGISSMLDIPLRSGGQLFGVLCFEQVGGLRKWDGAEEKFAVSAAAYMMLAIERAERLRTEEVIRKLNETLEQRIAERTAELVANERRFGLVVEQVQDYAIFILDTEGCVATWNAGAHRAKGYAADEIIGRHYSCFYTAEDRAAGLPEELLRVAAEKGHVINEGWRVRKDGRRFWVQVVITAIRDAAGRLIEFGKVTHDLTERKRVESMLRESEEQFRSAMENSAIGMALVSPEGRFLKVNASLCGILGYRAEELLTLDFQAITEPEDLDADLDNVRRMLAGEIATYQMEKRYLRKDGSVVWVLLTVSLVRGDGGVPIYFISQIQEITERKQAEEVQRGALEQQKELARSAQAGERAKSEFLAMMSHEVRTPMNGILGFAELLTNMTDLPSEGRDYANTILQSGTALLRILDDILDLSRLEAGAFEIETAPFFPVELIRDIHTLLTPAALEKELELRLDAPAEAEDVYLGDAGRLRQIVLNLAGNAIKFTDRGRVTIGFRCGGLEVEFFVSDTGSGIESEGMDRLFEPFVQADSGHSRRYGGAGLGLSISRRLARLMGGSLTATSRRGEGSEFVARIPLQRSDGVPRAAVSPGVFNDAFAKEHPLSIMVVEDDRVNLKLILKMLRRLGYEPFSAQNGIEAVEAYRRSRPQCVLMDVQMPLMDGIEATRAIRKVETEAGLPSTFIAALTADTLSADRDRCMDAGMDRFLNKPLRSELLAQALAAAGDRAAALRPAGPATIASASEGA